MEAKRLTDEQMKELETAILKFATQGKITKFAAKGLIFALRQSKNLTLPVRMQFDLKTQLREGRGVAFAAHDVCQSSSRGNNINDLIAKLGSNFKYCGYHTSPPLGLGVSLSPDLYARDKEPLTFTIDQIENLDV